MKHAVIELYNLDLEYIIDSLGFYPQSIVLQYNYINDFVELIIRYRDVYAVVKYTNHKTMNVNWLTHHVCVDMYNYKSDHIIISVYEYDAFVSSEINTVYPVVLAKLIASYVNNVVCFEDKCSINRCYDYYEHDYSFQYDCLVNSVKINDNMMRTHRNVTEVEIKDSNILFSQYHEYGLCSTRKLAHMLHSIDTKYAICSSNILINQKITEYCQSILIGINESNKLIIEYTVNGIDVIFCL